MPRIRTATLKLILLVLASALSADSLANAARIVIGSENMEKLGRAEVQSVELYGLSFAARTNSTLLLERYNPFATGAGFLLGTDSGSLRFQALAASTYYRGIVSGYENSMAFLEVKPSGDITGFTKLNGKVWDLVGNKSSRSVSSAAAADPFQRGAPDFSNDTTPSAAQLRLDNRLSEVRSRTGRSEIDVGDLNFGTVQFGVSQDTTLVFSASVPTYLKANLTLTVKSGAANLSVLRYGASVCSAPNITVTAECNDLSPGNYTVKATGLGTGINEITLDLAAVGDFPEGTGFEATIAIDTDYALYSQLGSLGALQSYLAALFAYNNSIYVKEINTELKIGSIRARSTPTDDPYYANPDQGSDCRLSEFQQKWHQNPQLKGVERTLASHFTNIPFGGIANLAGACEESYLYDEYPASPDCPNVTTKIAGDYSVNGVFGSSASLGEQIVFDNFVTSHEWGHNFNSPHTHCYNGIEDSSTIDACYSGEAADGCWAGPESLPGRNSLTGGSYGERNGTIMSYCLILGGNIAGTFGLNHPYGVKPDRVPRRMSNYVASVAALNPQCLKATNLPTPPVEEEPSGLPIWLLYEATKGSKTPTASSSYTLTVNTTGDGAVTSMPSGINCGSTCSASFPANTSVTLTATSSGSDSFTGWSGDCTGAGTCAVAMTANKSVGAAFSNQTTWNQTTIEIGYLPEGGFSENNFELPAAAQAMRVTMSGDGSGDADLYVSSEDFFIETGGYECASEGSTAAELCSPDDLAPISPGGNYYVDVKALTAVSNITVLIEWR